jgi:hypothetical protein
MTNEMEVYLAALMKLLDNAPEEMNIIILIGDEEGLHVLQNCGDDSATTLIETVHHLRGGNAVPDEAVLS